MKKLLSTMMAIAFCGICYAQSGDNQTGKILSAQMSQSISYQDTKSAPVMRWVCPEVEKYQDLLYSQRDDDYKVYANNIKNKIELFTNQEQPTDKYLLTQAILTIENPLYSTENLLNYISKWIKSSKKDWAKNLTIDIKEKRISAVANIFVASHATYVELFKVSVSPKLFIQLLEDNKLLISFSTNSYKNGVYDSHNKLSRTLNEKISEVFPFVQKSSHKNTYAKAYVGTYTYFWSFIADLRNELNANFTKDTKMLSQLHYEYSRDSLRTKYGEPTKVIADQTSTPDINKEIHFYESAQKFVFMGKTIDFKDIMSCEIVDDPQYIPGRSKTLGTGICIFGFGIGGAETVRTPDKTIHNYVVNVKIDDLGTPLIRIGTGQNEYKATEIASAFEYILRHQQSNNVIAKPQSRTVTRRRK